MLLNNKKKKQLQANLGSLEQRNVVVETLPGIDEFHI
jgi:hypothetical protein